MSNKMGMILAVDGIDGSGKSTLVRSIAEHLKLSGIDAVVLGQPGGTVVGKDIRKIFKNSYETPIMYETEVMLLMASFLECNREIRHLIAEGTTVVIDRWLNTILAYQGAGRGMGNLINNILLESPTYVKPDLQFTINLSPKIARERLIARGALDRIEQESLSFFSIVNDRQVDLCNNDGGYILDGEKSQWGLYKDTIPFINSLFGITFNSDL